jgi:hypothetical protein
MTTREALRTQVMAATWEELRDHHARGGLVLLAVEEDLLATGLAIAQDDKTRVVALLERGALGKPSDEAARIFAARANTRFQVLVVQPFVLAQELLVAQPS